jgi:hypothetical protein
VTTTTMLKVMRARQESVAINNIKNYSTLSVGSSWLIEHMKRPWIDPIRLPSITTIVTMMRVVAKMIKSGLIVVNLDTSVYTRLQSYMILVTRVLRYKLDLCWCLQNQRVGTIPNCASESSLSTTTKPPHQDLITKPTPSDNDDGIFYDSNNGNNVEFDDFLANTNAFTEEVEMRMNRPYEKNGQ